MAQPAQVTCNETIINKAITQAPITILESNEDFWSLWTLIQAAGFHLFFFFFPRIYSNTIYLIHDSSILLCHKWFLSFSNSNHSPYNLFKQNNEISIMSWCSICWQILEKWKESNIIIVVWLKFWCTWTAVSLHWRTLLQWK